MERGVNWLTNVKKILLWQNHLLYLFARVDPLDLSSHANRPTDAIGMENPPAYRLCQSHPRRLRHFSQTLLLPELISTHE